MELSQQLVQAIYHQETPLAQLPYVTSDALRIYQKQKKRQIRSIAQFLEMSDPERKVLLKNLSPEQTMDVVEVARKYPQLEIVQAKFRGEL